MGTEAVRELAVRLVSQVLEERKRSDEVVAKAAVERGLGASSRGFLRELVYGVIRHRRTLDSVLRQFSVVSSRRMDPALAGVLRLAIYQILFLDRVAPAVATHAAVEQVKASHRGKAAGFANAVLRGVIRSGGRVEGGGHDPKRFLPVEGGGWLFDRPLFPGPGEEPVRHLGMVHSYPNQMVRRWLDRFGWERTVAICRAGNRRPEIYVRANTVRIDAYGLIGRLAEGGIEAERAAPPAEAVRVLKEEGLFATAAWREGLFQVQDRTAIGIGHRLGPRPGERVLDLCAAPGGKATHLAALMEDGGKVVAADVSVEGLERVRENCGRLGLTCVEAVLLDREWDPAVLVAKAEGGFDRVLVDVPCSNTGVLGRRPEVRWRFRVEGLRRLTRLQGVLLVRGAELVRPGGVLVYSTCSIEREENEDVVGAFARGGGFELEGEETVLPGGGGDGGFWCRLRRKEAPFLALPAGERME